MAEGISIDLTVHDRGTAVVKRFGVELGSLFKKFGGDGAAAASKFKSTMSGVTSSLQHGTQAAGNFGKGVSGLHGLLGGLAAALAALGLSKLVGDITSTAQNMERLQLAMNAAAGGAKEGAAEMQFIREQSERLGLELASTADAYKGLLAATTAAGKETDEARYIFLGVAEAARAMGLSTEDTKGTLLAVQQIMSKGKVSAEELRQQLGERFPVAVGLMSKALGVTVQQLDKMLEQGQLTADTLLPFATELRKKFGPELAGAIDSSVASQARLKNAFNDLKTAIGQGGLLDAVKIVSDGLTQLFKDIGSTDAPRRLGEAFKFAATELVRLGKEYGPQAVEVIIRLAKVVSENFKPALDAIAMTGRQVWAGFQAGANQAIIIVGTVVAKIAQAAGWLQEQGAKLTSILPFSKPEEVKRIEESAAGYRRIQEEMQGVVAQAKAARDASLDFIRVGPEEAPKAADAIKEVKQEVQGVAEAAQNTQAETDNSLSHIEAKGDRVAAKIKADFQETGESIKQSFKGAADAAEQAFDRMAERSKMLSEQTSQMNKDLDGLAEFYSKNSRIEYGDTMQELQEQLKFFQRERSTTWLNSNETSARGYQQFLNEQFDAIIGDIQERIAGLREQDQGGVTGTGSSGYDVGTTRRNGSTRGSGSGSSGGGSASSGSLVLGSSSGSSRTGGGSSAGGGTVIIEGAQFNINQNGIDPQAIDARGLVRAMLPALREEIRRGELAGVRSA